MDPPKRQKCLLIQGGGDLSAAHPISGYSATWQRNNTAGTNLQGALSKAVASLFSTSLNVIVLVESRPQRGFVGP
jgi:hypothetical protein